MNKTIAYLSDAHPADYPNNGITKLTEDLNRIVPNSPSGTVDLLIFVGDMIKVADTKAALAASTISTIPTLYVVSNHHLQNLVDLEAIKAETDAQLIPLGITLGPLGSARTTFSYDIGDMHIVQLNEYWNGMPGGGCDAPWFIPTGGSNKDDGCMKYSESDGGYIPDALYTWLETDLTATTKPYKIVLGHEPLYPDGNHLGNSLDKDVANRDKLQALFKTKGVSVFISGHTHVASLDLHETVYHAGTGVSGNQVGEGQADNFSTITYTEDTPSGLVITQKSGTPNWTTPKITTFTIQPSTPTPEPTSGDGCNCNCNCNCNGTPEPEPETIIPPEPTILENTLTPQKKKVSGMTKSVYDAVMKAVNCADPTKCTKNVVIWKENPENPLGWDMGDTTLAKTAWSESMTKTPGDDGEYTFYNDTGTILTIDDMPSNEQSSSKSLLILGIGAIGIAYAASKLRKNKQV